MRSMLLIFFVVFASCPAFAEPIEWPVSEGGNGHYYETIICSSDTLSWKHAFLSTQGLSHEGQGGHLATITSATENSWIVNTLLGQSGITNAVIYLGGWNDGFVGEEPFYNNYPIGSWRWITGENWAFEDWAPEEPSTADGILMAEFALSMFHQYDEGRMGWNNLRFEYWDRPETDPQHTRAYIVEFDGYAVTDQPPLDHVVAVENCSWGSLKSLYR
ncbi:MAG: hypothetical protein KOO60_01175 [Gemmatimonadales bacterium]|nr:hypothetical protein [Gemmatimonadales bacterium]